MVMLSLLYPRWALHGSVNPCALHVTGLHREHKEHSDRGCRVQEKQFHPQHGGSRKRGTYTGGPPGPDPLRRLPPPPSLPAPPLLTIDPLPGFGPEVPDHGRRRRPKEILLDLVEGEKLGFCPMCLYSKYPVFLGEPNSG